MKHNLVSPIIISLALLFSGFNTFAGNKDRKEHRNTHRTEQRSGHRGNASHARPGKPSGDKNHSKPRPGKPSGDMNHSKPRPGKPHGDMNHSKPRPGSGSYGSSRPNHYRPNPPRPPRGPRPHPHYNGYRRRPSVGINVSFGGVNLFYSNGLYYNRYTPTQYVVTLPPVGMIVQTLYNPAYEWFNNGYYYISQGVVYTPVRTAYGPAYQVVDYCY